MVKDYSGQTINEWYIIKKGDKRSDNSQLYWVNCPCCKKEYQNLITRIRKYKFCRTCCGRTLGKRRIGRFKNYEGDIINNWHVIRRSDICHPNGSNQTYIVICPVCLFECERTMGNLKNTRCCQFCSSKSVAEAKKCGTPSSDIIEHRIEQAQVLALPETIEIDQLRANPYSDAQFDPSQRPAWSE